MFFTSPLRKTIKKLLASGKGILAADESTSTIEKRFAAFKIENTEANRRAYRELLFTTTGANHYISGVILFDETIHQSTVEGVPFPKLLLSLGIVPGIKVDEGLKPFGASPVEKVTQGLVGLPERLLRYYNLGARFAKWRAVFTVSDDLPSDACIKENVSRLAQYAWMCQQQEIVPIVEPEILMEGNHSIEQVSLASKKVLRALFEALKEKKVDLRYVLLKPSMVVSGHDAVRQAPIQEVACLTLQCFRQTVPAQVPGIVFLSGGQSEEDARRHLNAIANLGGQVPWVLTFSFGRALQDSVLRTWQGRDYNRAAAQEVFLKEAMLASLAQRGKDNE